MCTHLDATEGIISCKITNELSSEPTTSPIKHYNNKNIVKGILSYPLLVPPMASPFFHPIPRNMAGPNDVTGIS